MAVTFLPYTTDLVTALGWTILHSLWQALLVFACLRLVLKLWPAATASTKYNLSFLSLAGIFGWFVVTLYRQLDAVKQLHATATLSNDGIAGGAMLVFNMPAAYEQQKEMTGMFPSLELFFPILVAIYIAGVGVMCIKLAADLAQLQQIRKRQVLPVDAAWEQYMQKLAQQLHIPRKVKLLISQHLQVPVMIGFLKPVVLLPVAMFNNLSAEQLEAILLHELAHIKRNDYLLNIFQSIVETTLFFNPFIWWISKYIRMEREHCCDDMVVAHTAQPLHYAKALVVLEEYRFTNNPMAMAAADNKQHLFYRIKRIMEMKTSHLNYSQKFMAVVIIATGITAIAWITPSAAKEDNKGVAVAQTAAAMPAIDANVIPAAHPLDLSIPQDTVPAEEVIEPAAPVAGEAAPVTTDTAGKDVWTQDEKAAKDQWRQEEKLNKDQWKSVKDAQQKARIAQQAAQKAMQDAMKNIDWKAINEQTAKALKAVDWNKINQEIKSSMESIDWNKINQEVDDAVKESKNQVDPEMIRQSVELGLKSAQAALANVDMQRLIQLSMQQVGRDLSKEEREHMHKEMDKARLEQRKAMQDAQQQMQQAKREAMKAQQDAMQQNKAMAARQAERAKVQQANYKELIKRLDEDKLINADQSFTIEKKNGTLYINGTQQPASVLEKYSRYLGGKTLIIKGGKDSLDVNVNDNNN